MSSANRSPRYSAAFFEDEALTIALGSLDISDAKTNQEAEQLAGFRAGSWLFDNNLSSAVVRIVKDGVWLQTFPVKIQYAPKFQKRAP
jgi:hypothetical protein